MTNKKEYSDYLEPLLILAAVAVAVAAVEVVKVLVASRLCTIPPGDQSFLWCQS